MDEGALIVALERGVIGGAALDVIDGEFTPSFNPKTNPLIKYARSHSNLILTPHIGGSTVDAWRETHLCVINKLIKYFDSKKT